MVTASTGLTGARYRFDVYIRQQGICQTIRYERQLPVRSFFAWIHLTERPDIRFRSQRNNMRTYPKINSEGYKTLNHRLALTETTYFSRTGTDNSARPISPRVI